MAKDKVLDLNIPADAREFILKAMKKVLPGITYFQLADGRKLSTKSLTDSEAVQYAFELLPIYQAKFPDLVNVTYEH